MKEKFATWYKIVTKHIRFFFSYSIPMFFKKVKNYINLPIIVVGLALIIGLFIYFPI